MKKLLITAAAFSVALIGCKTTEPPTFEQETNEIYVWDESKSTAKNWADIAVVPNGVKDAERAEDAQELISEAEQNAWTLISFASGGLAQGLGMSSVFGIIDDAQRWWPTYVLLVEPQQLTAESVLAEIDSKFEPMFNNSKQFTYHGVSYRTHSRNYANVSFLVSGEGCNYTTTYEQSNQDVLNMPTSFKGCFIEVMVKVMPRVKLPSGELADVISVEQRIASKYSLSLAKHYDGPVVFPVNYQVQVDGQDTKIPFPFVYSNDKAYLFTKSDATLELDVQ
tara:strand:- start:17107 stop:17946 length:840 start_codon:yes stop_codon:yes gene_type:complete